MQNHKELVGRSWDVVVIGAGLAGSVAARELARRGLSVALLDKSAAPRRKVCGDCLSGLGVRALQRIGLGGVLDEIGAAPVDRVEVRCGRGAVRTTGAGVWAVPRPELDAALERSAADAGAGVFRGAHVELDGERVAVRGAGEVRTRAIVLASGLRTRGPDERVAKRALIGAGVVGPAAGRTGVVMAIGRGGYVGRVHLPGNVWNWAAALDPAAVRDAGGVAPLVETIWRGCGLRSVEVPNVGWSGTPGLTRRRGVQRGRVFAVGDAARFVEPITGEGMSWAIATGAAVTPYVAAAVSGDPARGAWRRGYRRLVGARQARCAVVSRALRRPVVVESALRAIEFSRLDASGALAALIGSAHGRGAPA
ncbi:MAG: NAD(P)/FAD-dependent oxidoreductase [Phycisphaerales bacterium]